MRQRRAMEWARGPPLLPSNGKARKKEEAGTTKSLWQLNVLDLLPKKRVSRHIQRPKARIFVLLLSFALLLKILWSTIVTLFSKDGQPKQLDRLRQFEPMQQTTDGYHVFHCPDTPPSGYPREYPILDVLDHWHIPNVDDPPDTIYQGLCVFDLLATDSSSNSIEDTEEATIRKIQTYRAAEVPFVIRNDPAVLESVRLWSNTDYLSSRLANNKLFLATLSNTTIMKYYSLHPQNTDIPDGFVPPTRDAPMSFQNWYTRANSTDVSSSHEYAYLRLDACLPNQECDSTYRSDPKLADADFVYDDLNFFQASTPETSPLYSIDKDKSRGIQCRFGAPGLVAENHFDNERNYIAMIGGERRYLLAHPKNCPNLYLHPQRHPFERHTRVDWSNPSNANLQDFPEFHSATVNEVVLRAGDVLYLPTFWFHHIVSLTLNYQCNTRSGYSVEHDQTIFDCGFMYDFPE